MGGVSQSGFEVRQGAGEQGGPAGLFNGQVSSSNNGGFASVSPPLWAILPLYPPPLSLNPSPLCAYFDWSACCIPPAAENHQYPFDESTPIPPAAGTPLHPSTPAPPLYLPYPMPPLHLLHPILCKLRNPSTCYITSSSCNFSHPCTPSLLPLATQAPPLPRQMHLLVWYP